MTVVVRFSDLMNVQVLRISTNACAKRLHRSIFKQMKNSAGGAGLVATKGNLGYHICRLALVFLLLSEEQWVRLIHG